MTQDDLIADEAAYRETRKWRLQNKPAALWPYLSDISNINEMLGQPARYTLDIPFNTMGLRRIIEGTENGQTVHWLESPAEWVSGQWWRQERFYEKGPLEKSLNILYLQDDPAGGTLLDYTISVWPRNRSGKALSKGRMIDRAMGAMETACKTIDEALLHQGVFHFVHTNKKSQPDEALIKSLSEVADPDLAVSFGAYLASAPDTELHPLRPSYLQRAIQNASEGALLNLCVAAASVRALNFAFHSRCDHCGTLSPPYGALAEFGELLECSNCNKQERRDLHRNIEAHFWPADNQRKHSSFGYCDNNPYHYKRRLVQQIMGPAERREFPFRPLDGRYRARSGQHEVTEDISIQNYEIPVLRLTNAGLRFGEIATQGSVVFENHLDGDMLFSLENLDQARDLWTGAQVLMSQAFRQWRPNERIGSTSPIWAGSSYLLTIQLLDDDMSMDLGKIALFAHQHNGAVVDIAVKAALVSFFFERDAHEAILSLHKTQQQTGEYGTAAGLHRDYIYAFDAAAGITFGGPAVEGSAALCARANAGETLASREACANPGAIFNHLAGQPPEAIAVEQIRRTLHSTRIPPLGADIG